MTSPLQSRRPETRNYKVEDLLALAKAGRLRIPDFQRPFRWRVGDVLDLFDSIARGFPVGVLLLRQAPAEAATLHFGSVKVGAPAMHDALWVVDGQQRLTTLVATLLRTENEPRGDLHAIWYDLAEERFVPLRQPPSPTMIPLRALGDMTTFMNWLEDWPLRKELPALADRAKLLFKTLNEHVIPATLVQDAGDDELRLLFSRMNTTGARLSESDVFQALLTDPHEARPISAAATRLSHLEFGPISDDDFLRCHKTVADIAPRVRLETPQGASIGNLGRTEEAIRRTIGFLVNHADFPALTLLPYRLPLYILARFFDRHAAPQPRTLELLSRWVWRGAVSGQHSDTSHAAISQLQRLVDDDEPESVRRLLTTTPLTNELRDPHEFATLVFNARAAVSRIASAALLTLDPRDPSTGTPLRFEALGHQTLSASFRDLGSGRKSIIARRLWWPDGKKGEVIAALHGATDEVLASHALTREDVEILAEQGADAFAKHRVSTLNQLIGDVITLRLGRLDGDRRSIATLSRLADRATQAAPP